MSATGLRTDPSRFGPYPEDLVSGAAGLTTTSAVELIAALAGAKIVCEDLSISNNSATASEVILLDGSTEIGRFPAPAGGGSLPRINKVLTAGNALNAKLSIAATTVNVFATGYKFVAGN